jgi:hypothetical protein
LEEWIAERLPDRSAESRTRILVVDTDRQRPVAKLPGESAVFSHNGRWLATLDGGGVLRVYELPLRKPWLRILSYTALTVCVFSFLGFLRGRLRSHRASDESPSSAR